MNEERLIEIERQLEAIRERNQKVEVDKDWEKSLMRIVSILIATYIIAAVALIAIANDRPFLNALIPVIGFFLSTQSFPFLKQIWIKRYTNNKSS